ncbi:ATP-dependent RNA helicase HrpA [Sediminivirga luteola]|uniref:ATP-dependent RNA helicase HrpA n=1 Tax=Sediminivirga luteola TaxID=1774748 RepID=UPI001F55F097|nr:ATP-dependent RNA helicase HrpA [Sediminivirga luteola]MCI2265555.1 ATP-dependent RNA helicase HrpA [Sediminivirga luteola]
MSSAPEPAPSQRPEQGPEQRPERSPEQRSAGASGRPKRARSRGRRRGSQGGPGNKRHGDRQDGGQRRQQRERLRQARAAVELHPQFPPELPVSAVRDEIAAAIRDHQVVVIAGETGSGKTTQLPKICLALGRGVDGMIGHTQPRRIAARTVSERIAEELGTVPGTAVGHQVRFQADVKPETRVKVMTDGILLAEIQHDPLLRAYDTIIIDEAHERSLNIDFLLGYLKTILPKRPDLKLIITSATINPHQFAAHFGDAPVLEVSGRTYPVEVRYRPLAADQTAHGGADPDADEAGDPELGRAVSQSKGERSDDRDQLEGILDAVRELLAEPPGDILVFLSGEREIRDTKEALEGWLPGLGPKASRYEVLPMFSRLSAAEQHRIFTPGARPRIVLATNVAETSVTVPGIKYVIDPGTARISRFSTRTKVQRLPIEPISQASADQRKGRCGRTSDGICIRLYSEEDYLSRDRFTDPEILRTNLANVVLTMASLGFADDDAAIESFPFLTPPSARAIRDGRQLLGELGALVTGKDGRNHLSKRGRRISRIPLDPRLAGIILAGAERGVAAEAIVIVAALSIQDPRERPLENQAEAKGLHRRFDDPDSDFFALLNLWTYLQERRRELGSSQFRKLCRREFLNYVRIREWQDLVGQLQAMVSGEGVEVGPLRWTFAGAGGSDADGGAASDAGGQYGARGDQKSARGNARQGGHALGKAVHCSVLAGMLSHIGARTPDEKGYLGARGTRFAIFPGSALFKKPPQLIVAAELVETSRLWARTNARIEPEWVEEVGGDLVKRQLSEPHWSSKQGQACAYERTSLYGVTLIAGRRVALARHDPVLAREIFIREGIVEGGWRGRHEFLARNREVLKSIEELESRTRRRGLIDDQALYEFYDERLPADIVSGRHFDSWWKKARQEDPGLLDLTPEQLLGEDEPGAEADDAFPLHWPMPDGSQARISYRHEPGSDADGATVHIPVALLNQLEPEVFSWQVPGLRDELATAWLRSLPKQIRRHFVPAPDVAAAVLDGLEPYRGELRVALADGLTRYAATRSAQGGHGENVQVDPEDFDPARVPAHLRLRFAIHDESGAVIATGEDLASLQAKNAPAVKQTLSRAAVAFEREGLRDWDLSELPETFSGNSAGRAVTGYPALVDRGSAVDLVVLDREDSAASATWAGTRRLLLLRAGDPSKTLAGYLTTQEKLVFAGAEGGVAGVLADCALATVDRIMVESGLDPDSPRIQLRRREEFEALRLRVRDELLDKAVDVVRLVHRVLAAAAEVAKGVSRASSLILLAQLQDISAHQASLLGSGFVAATGWKRLQHLPRYVQADLRRLDKLPENPARDKSLMDRVHAQQEALRKAESRLKPGTPPGPALVEVRWMIEELRVSFFAQELGTPKPVSEQRIQKALQEAR